MVENLFVSIISTLKVLIKDRRTDGETILDLQRYEGPLKNEKTLNFSVLSFIKVSIDDQTARTDGHRLYREDHLKTHHSFVRMGIFRESMAAGCAWPVPDWTASRLASNWYSNVFK